MMNAALWLLAALGFLGAFDTLYYHEWRARLPAQGAFAAPELKLHAARDFFYAVLFCTLPWLAWCGAWVWVLVAVIVIEIILTLWDFIVELTVRKPLGGDYAGERVAHAFMGIVYGATVACLVPEMLRWSSLPTGLVHVHYDLPKWLIVLLVLMGVGVFLSGLRDLYAALGLPHGNWPWPKSNNRT